MLYKQAIFTFNLVQCGQQITRTSKCISGLTLYLDNKQELDILSEGR